MIPLFGRTAVLVGLAACAIGAVTGIFAGARRSEEAWRWTRWMAYVFGVSASVAVGLMEYALLTHDFSVSYVAEVGSRSTPVWVTIVSLWSSLSGSILLWSFILAMYTAAFAWWTRKRHADYTPWALGITLAVGVFFCFLVAGVANPFEASSPVPTDGPGPNPLLQNHVLMIIHPPMLYLGYVGMSVPFGMAVAALLAGRLDADWTRALRRWMLIPWGSLTIGIILGGWWSYEVLGWGGYWAWDPVENASLLPWLTATAFLHSAMVMERRDHLKGWTIVLVLATFLLTILGTFMTRSGVFNSVHSFTQSPIGPVFLGFLGVCLVGSVLLLAARVDKLTPPAEGMAGPISREISFLANNLLFAALTFTVLLGTIYPLLNEVVTDTQISVGEPYFNRMAAPIGVAIVFLMGIGPALPWGRAEPGAVGARLAIPAVIGVIVAGACAAVGMRGFWPLLSFGAAAFAAAVHGREVWEAARIRGAKTGEALPVALVRVIDRARRRFGGYIVHLGVLIIAVSVAASMAYTERRHVSLTKGEATEIHGYTLVFVGTERVTEPHRVSSIARFSVSKDGRDLGLLEPRMNTYLRMGSPIGTPAVHSGLREDLYLSLIQVDDSAETASLDVIVEPLIWWIWFGGGVMVLGTMVAAWPTRRRRRDGKGSAEERRVDGSDAPTQPAVASVARAEGRL